MIPIGEDPIGLDGRLVRRGGLAAARGGVVAQIPEDVAGGGDAHIDW
jgi:hypothetical protein